MHHFRGMLALVMFLPAATAAAAPNTPFFTQAIQTAPDAISVARALQIARTREQPLSPTRDEAFWQTHFTATLTNGVWEVKSKSRYSPDIAVVTVLVGQDGKFRGLRYCHQADCGGPR